MADHTLTAREVLRQVTERTLQYDFTVWFWGDAIAIDGLLDAAELLEDSAPRDFCLAFYRRWAKRPLNWVDHLTPGVGLLQLYKATGEAALLEAAQRLAAWMLEEVPRAPGDGPPLYRPDLSAFRHSAWVDTIYHVPPFYALLGQVTGETRYYDEAVDEWLLHAQALAQPSSPILAHSYDTGSQLLKGYGWGRGNGWALFGMVDTLALLPKDHPRYSEALASFHTLSAEVLRLQDASGFWRTLIHDQEAYLEASTAPFFGGCFTKGVRLGLLNGAYAAAAERAWQATLSRLRPDGSLYGVSAVTVPSTHPDDDTKMYKTLPTEVNVWGQGSALRFAAERLYSSLD
jgi:unsaturated rhamnogalacturonyl hydrolase